MTAILEWDNDAAADRLKSYAIEKEKAKETKYKSKYGKKRYKEFMAKDADAKEKQKNAIRNPKGVRALHKGKWGYMKNRKFTEDKK